MLIPTLCDWFSSFTPTCDFDREGRSPLYIREISPGLSGGTSLFRLLDRVLAWPLCHWNWSIKRTEKSWQIWLWLGSVICPFSATAELCHKIHEEKSHTTTLWAKPLHFCPLPELHQAFEVAEARTSVLVNLVFFCQTGFPSANINLLTINLW